MSCCLSMSTVNPTPGVCQNPCCGCGDGGASNVGSILNTVGKFGLSVAGIMTGRPVVTSGNRVAVGPSATYQQQIAAQPNYTVIIVVIALAVLAFFALRR